MAVRRSVRRGVGMQRANRGALCVMQCVTYTTDGRHDSCAALPSSHGEEGLQPMAGLGLSGKLSEPRRQQGDCNECGRPFVPRHDGDHLCPWCQRGMTRTSVWNTSADLDAAAAQANGERVARVREETRSGKRKRLDLPSSTMACEERYRP